jgi:hypothetical protein
MEQEARRKGPRSPSEESDGLRRRSKKYDRSPSPRRRYRRSRSRSSSRERNSRRKDAARELEWKTTMQSVNKASNPPNSTAYPQPVLNQYNVRISLNYYFTKIFLNHFNLRIKCTY